MFKVIYSLGSEHDFADGKIGKIEALLLLDSDSGQPTQKVTSAYL